VVIKRYIFLTVVAVLLQFSLSASASQADSLCKDIEQFSKDSGEYSAELFGSLAVYYHNKGDFAKALDWTERIIRRQPDNYQMQLYKAQLLFALGRYKECEKVLKTIESRKQIADSPLLVSVRTLLYQAYKAQGRISKEEKRIENKLKKKKVSLDDFRQAFVLFRISENYPKTIEYAKKAIKAYPKESSFRLALAYAYEKKAEVKQAISEYRELIKKFPDNPSGYELLLNLFKRENQLKQAEKLWRGFVSKGTDNAYRRLQLVDILYTAGNFDAAAAQLDIMQKAPSNDYQVFMLVRYYRSLIEQQRGKN